MISILNRAMIILERVRNMQQLSTFATGLFGVLLVFGIINCIFGYRLLRFWMMLFGFAIGAGLGFFGIYQMGTQDKTIYAAAMAAAGIILAIISFLIFKAGVFVLGAGIGLTLSIYVIHPTSSLAFFACLLAGVGIGAVAMRYEREVLIIGTSILGGILAGISTARLADLPEIPHGIAISAAFAVLGMIIQFLINKPKYEEEEYEAEDDVRQKRKHTDYELNAAEEEKILEEYFDDYYGESKSKNSGRKNASKMPNQKNVQQDVPVSDELDDQELEELHQKAWEQKKRKGRRAE